MGAGLAQSIQWPSYGLNDGGSIPDRGSFLFANASRQAVGPTQSGVFLLVVKRPGRDADNPPPSSAVVENEWRYISTPPYVYGVVLS
jgi:hypothetical protein